MFLARRDVVEHVVAIQILSPFASFDPWLLVLESRTNDLQLRSGKPYFSGKPFSLHHERVHHGNPFL